LQHVRRVRLLVLLLLRRRRLLLLLRRRIVPLLLLLLLLIQLRGVLLLRGMRHSAGLGACPLTLLGRTVPHWAAPLLLVRRWWVVVLRLLVLRLRRGLVLRLPLRRGLVLRLRLRRRHQL
jgi:hypothetical protein